MTYTPYSDAALQVAILEIENTYGQTVSVLEKKKTLLKFGRNDDLSSTASFATVWTVGGDETYVEDNLIVQISSTDAGDTTLAYIEGHTKSGTGSAGVFTFVTQSVSLSGQNAVALTTPLARCSRVANLGPTNWAGAIYVAESATLSLGSPSAIAKIHNKILAGDQQSYKCATTFSNSDYAIITGGWFSVNRKLAAQVDFEMEIRLPGQVFKPVARITGSTDGVTTGQINFNPYVIVPHNSDVRIRARPSATGAQVNAAFQAYLAIVVG